MVEASITVTAAPSSTARMAAANAPDPLPMIAMLSLPACVNAVRPFAKFANSAPYPVARTASSSATVCTSLAASTCAVPAG